MAFPKNKTALGCYCRLNTGEIKAYDECSDEIIYDPDLRFIGLGVIHMINGERQHDPDEYFFYLKK